MSPCLWRPGPPRFVEAAWRHDGEAAVGPDHAVEEMRAISLVSPRCRHGAIWPSPLDRLAYSAWSSRPRHTVPSGVQSRIFPAVTDSSLIYPCALAFSFGAMFRWLKHVQDVIGALKSYSFAVPL